MKHTKAATQPYPTARKIKRECSNELYRAIKRMNIYIDKEVIEQAEKYYMKQVITHYQTINSLSNNRKKQLEWWEEHCSEQLSQLLNVDRTLLIKAFTDAYLTRYS